jgi:hypothetical protein
MDGESRGLAGYLSGENDGPGGGCRSGESLEDAARRVAIDALYAARDAGGTMHDAGAAAGDAVSRIYRAAMDGGR